LSSPFENATLKTFREAIINHLEVFIAMLRRRRRQEYGDRRVEFGK